MTWFWEDFFYFIFFFIRYRFNANLSLIPYSLLFNHQLKSTPPEKEKEEFRKPKNHQAPF